MEATGLKVTIRINETLEITRVIAWDYVLAQMAAQLGTLPPVAPSQPRREPQADSPRDFLSIGELAARWRVSRGTVYNRLRSLGIKVLNFAPRGKRSRKAIPVKAILEVESQQSKRIQ